MSSLPQSSPQVQPQRHAGRNGFVVTAQVFVAFAVAMILAVICREYREPGAHEFFAGALFGVFYDITRPYMKALFTNPLWPMPFNPTPADPSGRGRVQRLVRSLVGEASRAWWAGMLFFLVRRVLWYLCSAAVGVHR